jgi:hypothetical protein
VVHYYLSPIGAGPSEQVPGGLDLVRFVSEPLVDADSIAAIADPADRAEVLMHLCNATPDAEGSVREAVQVVWQRTNELGVPGTLRQIDPTTGLLSDSIIPGTGRASTWRVHPGRETAAGEFSLRRAAVASNFDDCPQANGRFAVPDLVQGFPHGFEVQVVGPTSSRKVLMRLVLVDTTQGKLPVWNEFQTILPAHAR